MKKQFRRAGALMLALLMLMMAAPALAEDAPSAADGTQIEEIIGEEPAVTEAPTAIPTEIPTEAPTNTPNPTGIPTEAPTETPIQTEIPTEEPTNTAIPTEIPTEAPTETPISTDAPTEAPTATPDEDVFVPGLATLRSGAKLYANQQLTGDADVTEVSGTVYAEARTDSKRAVRIAFYDGVIVRTAWVKTSSTEMLTDEQTAAYDAIPRKPEDDLMAAHGHLLAPIPVHPEQKETPAPTEQPTEEPTATPEVTNPPEVTDAPTDVSTEAPTDVPEVTDAPTNPPEVTDAPTEVPEITEQPTAAPEVTNPPEITENPTEAPTDEIISDYTPVPATDAPTATPAPTEANATEIPEPTISIAPDELDDLIIGRALEQPTGISASYERSGRITLKWTAVEGANAYAIYYKPAWGSEYSLLGQSSGTTYSTTTPRMGTVYYYRIQALYVVGGQQVSQGAQSLSFPYIALGDVVIADPRGKDTSTIRLNWTPVAGATHYDVAMSLHDADDYKIVRTDLTGSLCDIRDISFNETYDFLVIPKRKLNSGDVITGLPSSNRMVGSPMETPSFTGYEWTETGLKLTWDAIPGAMGYVIYRRGFHETGYHKLMVSENTATTYIDTTMKPGEVYYYFVYSFRLAQPQGWRCFSLKGDIGMGVWLPKTTGLTAVSAQENSVRISWAATEGANKYDVYISTTPGGTPKANGRVSNAYGYHNSAVLGRTYYYRVRPVRIFSNGDVSVGDWSDELAYTHQETVGTYRALLIGNTYTGESNELPGCENDVDGMRTMLGRMTATPYSVTVKKNIRAEEILSSISSTFGNASYNDVSLFYYSGHGANSVGADGNPTSYHAALVGTFQTYVSIARLKTELDKIPGKKVIIIDACHSGQFIARDGTVTQVSSSAFNSQVVNLFANDEQLSGDVSRTAVVLAADGSELLSEEAPAFIDRAGDTNFAKSGYYVITACRSEEKSVSTGYDSNGDGKIDRYFGLFTYGLCYGNGWNLARNAAISSLNADLNKDSKVTLYEAYVYAKVMAQSHNPNQTAQIWPENSAFVLWGK
ncbi:MAG TPA: caspase family protein [Clostridiales bacterium]|nr:caspase family protein [Clostridiales bacterium]